MLYSTSCSSVMDNRSPTYHCDGCSVVQAICRSGRWPRATALLTLSRIMRFFLCACLLLTTEHNAHICNWSIVSLGMVASLFWAGASRSVLCQMRAVHRYPCIEYSRTFSFAGRRIVDIPIEIWQGVERNAISWRRIRRDTADFMQQQAAELFCRAECCILFVGSVYCYIDLSKYSTPQYFDLRVHYGVPELSALAFEHKSQFCAWHSIVIACSHGTGKPVFSSCRVARGFSRLRFFRVW